MEACGTVQDVVTVYARKSFLLSEDTTAVQDTETVLRFTRHGQTRGTLPLTPDQIGHGRI